MLALLFFSFLSCVCFYTDVTLRNAALTPSLPTSTRILSRLTVPVALPSALRPTLLPLDLNFGPRRRRGPIERGVCPSLFEPPRNRPVHPTTRHLHQFPQHCVTLAPTCVALHNWRPLVLDTHQSSAAHTLASTLLLLLCRALTQHEIASISCCSRCRRRLSTTCDAVLLRRSAIANVP